MKWGDLWGASHPDPDSYRDYTGSVGERAGHSELDSESASELG